MMEWESWSAFWDMGGNAWFVWGSYSITAMLIVLELVLVLRRRKETVLRLLRLRRAAPYATGGQRMNEEMF